MRKEQKCAAAPSSQTFKAAFHSVFAEVALGSLLPTGTREQLFEKAGLSESARHALRKLLAEDEVITAQGLEPVWRRAATGLAHWLLFWGEGQWQGRIFCLAFLRLPVSLEAEGTAWHRQHHDLFALAYLAAGQVSLMRTSRRSSKPHSWNRPGGPRP